MNKEDMQDKKKGNSLGRRQPSSETQIHICK